MAARVLLASLPPELEVLARAYLAIAPDVDDVDERRLIRWGRSLGVLGFRELLVALERLERAGASGGYQYTWPRRIRQR